MIRGLIVLMAIACVAVICTLSTGKERWVAFYAPNAPVEKLIGYSVLVFDSDHHPRLGPLKSQRNTVLGYISLGEADPNREFYPVFEQEDLLLPEDPHFAGHKVIDVRKQAWHDYVLNGLVPSILHQGFDGIIIDTLDSVTELESRDPIKYAGMRMASVKLVREIRQQYPGIKIMVNRGFAVLPAIASSIDMVLAESIYSVPQPGTGKFMPVPKNVYQHYINILKDAQRQSSALKIYTLDYWPQDDQSGIERIYAMQRSAGFIPYVSTRDLQMVYQEP